MFHCAELRSTLSVALIVAVPAKTKGQCTPQSPEGSSRMLVGAQPKLQRADRPNEKSRSSAGHEGHRPKVHDGLGEPHREKPHKISHHSNASRDGTKTGISKDGLRDGPKEIPHEVVWDRDREMYPLTTGQASLHTHRDGATRRSSSKHAEESRSKPTLSHALVTTQHRLAGRGVAEAKLGSGVKGEAKLSAKVT